MFKELLTAMLNLESRLSFIKGEVDKDVSDYVFQCGSEFQQLVESFHNDKILAKDAIEAVKAIVASIRTLVIKLPEDLERSFRLGEEAGFFNSLALAA